MKLTKIEVKLKLTNAPKEMDQKYYAILGAIFDVVDNNSVFEKQITSISPLIRIDEENFKFFISIFQKNFSDLFLQKLFSKQIVNIDNLPFKLQGINIVKTFDLVNFNPDSNYKKILLTLQSPTCFAGKNNKPHIDIQGFTLFKSVNKKLTKLGIDLNLDLLKVEQNIKLIGVKNLNSEKARIKHGYKIGLTGKLFYEVSGDDFFKKQIYYFVNAVEFLGIGLNPRLGMGNAYGKVILDKFRNSTCGSCSAL